MNTNRGKKWMSFVLWGVYGAVAVLAGYHTFNVFSLSDPPFFAFLGAVAVDGVLALTLMMVGRWYGDQQIAGIVGTIIFALLSGSMQVIAHKVAMHEALPALLQWGADYAVPISVTLSMITLGLIKYFDRDRNGVPDFLERPTPLAIGNISAVSVSNIPESVASLPSPSSVAMPISPMKRGPGRPPKVAFNTETAVPKALKKS